MYNGNHTSQSLMLRLKGHSYILLCSCIFTTGWKCGLHSVTQESMHFIKYMITILCLLELTTLANKWIVYSVSGIEFSRILIRGWNAVTRQFRAEFSPSLKCIHLSQRQCVIYSKCRIKNCKIISYIRNKCIVYSVSGIEFNRIMRGWNTVTRQFRAENFLQGWSAFMFYRDSVG
jgi:hypothetical protein